MAPVLPTKLSPCLQPSPAPKRDITIKIATAAAAAAAAAAATVSFTLTAKSAGWAPLVHSSSSAPQFADIAMIFDTTISLDPRIRAAFDTTSSSDDCLLHVGLVKKDGGFGRPSKVYAFGVYADGNDLKQQLKQYQSSSLSELKKNAELMNDVLERDIGMTVRLMTVEGGLSIREISSKISKLVEARLRKLDGQEKLVLQR